MPKHRKTLPISIIIPTKNEELNISRLLESIGKQTIIPGEVIVADGNSTDNTRAIALTFNHTRVIDGGSAMVGRNNGAKEAKYDIIYFIDADVVIPHRNYMENTYKHFLEHQLDLASALLKPDNDSDRGLVRPMMFFAWRTLQRTSNIIKRPLVGSSSFMIVKKQTFEKLHGFADSYFEDLDISSRAVKQGYNFANISPPILTSGRRFDTLPKTARTVTALGLAGLVFALGLYNRRTIMTWIEKLYGQLGGASPTTDQSSNDHK